MLFLNVTIAANTLPFPFLSFFHISVLLRYSYECTLNWGNNSPSMSSSSLNSKLELDEFESKRANWTLHLLSMYDLFHNQNRCALVDYPAKKLRQPSCIMNPTQYVIKLHAMLIYVPTHHNQTTKTITCLKHITHLCTDNTVAIASTTAILARLGPPSTLKCPVTTLCPLSHEMTHHIVTHHPHLHYLWSSNH